MNIGIAIKNLRLKQGLTQQELAERCGMSDQGLSNIETGKAYPPKGTVEKLCEALGVPTGYLMLSAIDERDFPEEKRVLFSLYKAMIEPLRNELLEKKED